MLLVLRVVDIAAAPIYLVLTITILASSVSPFLRDLASHGKTRDNTAVDRNYHWSFGCLVDNLLHREVFLVRKRCFLHFYLVGILSMICLLFEARKTDVFDAVPSRSHQVVAIVLLLVHLVRRSYECLFVHAWNRNSMMHIGGYCLGILHYILLAFVFVPPIKAGSATNHQVEDVSIGHPSYQIVRIFIGVTLCLLGQYEQHCHHCLLASLRGTNAKNNGIKEYCIPTGRWFQFVSCPHYLAEICIYIGFAILLNPLYSGSSFHTADASTESLSNREQAFRHVLLLRQYRHLILLIWVTCNLTFSALRNHVWYKDHFPPYRALQRKAIIPFFV